MDQGNSRSYSRSYRSQRELKDTAGTRALFELARQTVAFDLALLVSVLPGRGLGLMQPAKLPDGVFKAYASLAPGEDPLVWASIMAQRVVRLSDGSPGQAANTSAYDRKFLYPLRLRDALSVPLSEPVLPGYPGAVVLLRDEHAQDFSDAELQRAAELSGVMDNYLYGERPARAAALAAASGPWMRRPQVRFFLFDRQGRIVFPKTNGAFSSALEEGLSESVRKTAERRSRTRLVDVDIADERGEHWRFRLTVVPRFAVRDNESIVFASLQPECFEWAQVKPWEVAADEELVRMLPAVKFMYESFDGCPGLEEVAAKAHFSEFHFHRRFGALIGQTPKDFLVSCQMHAARQMLYAGDHGMTRIARRCGFSHQSHFASRFRQRVGLTPTRWQRMVMEARQTGD